MSGIGQWTAGTWAVFALHLAVVGGAAALILFSERIEARSRARRAADGDPDGDADGYRSPLDPSRPRTQGLILLAIGGYTFYRFLLLN